MYTQRACVQRMVWWTVYVHNSMRTGYGVAGKYISRNLHTRCDYVNDVYGGLTWG